MQIRREDVIYTMDRAMSEGNVLPENIEAAQREIQNMMNKGPVDGTWYITSHRPIIGKLIILVKRFMRKMLHGYIPPVVEEFNQIEVSQNKVLQHLTSAVQELSVQLVAAKKEREICQEYIKALEQEQKDYEERIVRAHQSTMQDMEKTVQTQQSAIQDIEQMVQTQQAVINEMGGVVREVQGKLTQIDQRSDAFSTSIAKTILAYKRENNLPVDKPAARSVQAGNGTLEEDIYTALDYFQFQNHFRGSRSLITERQTEYISYFKNCTEPVLDLGCGRGEFLCLLREAAIPAFGIDLYPEYVVEGELYGLDIRQRDGIAFLQKTDQCFGGIFSAQVIEHISFAQLQALCFAAYEKLTPGGCLILETPNPTCLAIYANSFYIDPTHQKPVHPSLLTYLLREAGFQDIQILYTKMSRTGEGIPKIEGDGICNLEEFNQAMDRISELLYGSQDYAVIARKGNAE